MGRKFLLFAVICATFFITPLIFAAEQRTAISDPYKVRISPEYGKIMETYAPKQAVKDQRMVVHVQDLHVNYEAQTNIAKMLGELSKKYGITQICVEGSTGKLDVSFFRDFPDKKARNETTEHFVKQGQITGPESLAITSDMPIELYGIETKEKYLAHLDVFNDYYKRMKGALSTIAKLNDILARLRAKVYSPELKEFEKKSEGFSAKSLAVTNYAAYLRGLASKTKLDLAKYPNFSLLCELIDLEKATDFKRVELERTRLIEAVSKKMTKAQAKELLDKSLGLKSGETSEAEFYAYLDARMDRSKDVEGYPNLVKYIDYTKKQSEADNGALFNEIDEVENSLKDALARTPEEKELVRLSRNGKFLKEMYDLKLTIEQYDYYKSNKEGFTPNAFLKFIDAGFAQLLKKTHDDNIVSLEKFYELGLVRDEALLDNALRYMKDNKAKVIVMITGGFHTKGITDKLKKEGIAYVVVSPNVTKEQDDELYFEVLSGKTEPLEETLEKNAEEDSNKD